MLYLQAIFELEMNSELKAYLKELYISGAKVCVYLYFIDVSSIFVQF